MKKIAFITFLLFIIAFVPLRNNFAETMFKDNFKDPNNWEYISDNVMGGVSSGKVEYQNNNAILRVVMFLLKIMVGLFKLD